MRKVKGPFQTDFLDGDESVMKVKNVTEIRFNHKTKEISIVTQTKKKGRGKAE